MQLPAPLISLLTSDLLETLALFAVILILRILIIRALRRDQETLTDTRRRWISIVQNLSAILIILGLIFIWSPQLSTFALSLTAFAVAMVIATKEYLLCLIGAAYRTGARPFGLGDWIDVNGVRGEVIAEGMLTTRLQELGEGSQRYEFTGRILTMPNSQLLTNTVRNESYRKRFIQHAFAVTLDPGVDPVAIRETIRKVLAEKTPAFDDVAERYLAMVKRKSLTSLPDREPTVSVETNHLAKVIFSVTVFCPTTEASAIEGAVTEAALHAAYLASKAETGAAAAAQ